MPFLRYERDPLVKIPDLNSKPTCMRRGHIGRDQTSRNVAPIRMRPRNPPETDVRVTANEPSFCEPI